MGKGTSVEFPIWKLVEPTRAVGTVRDELRMFHLGNKRYELNHTRRV